MEQAFLMVNQCDVLIIVGTSYYTSTAIDILRYAKALDKEVYEINSNASKRLPKLLKQIIKAD